MCAEGRSAGVPALRLRAVVPALTRSPMNAVLVSYDGIFTTLAELEPRLMVEN